MTNKRKYTCGDEKLRSICVYYDGNIPDWSILKEEDCRTLEETTEELYDEVDKLRTLTDFSDLTSDCITLTEEDGKVTLKTFAQDVLTTLEELKCPEEPTELTKDINLSEYDLDMKCLVDDCDNPITKLSVLLQALINQGCEEETPETIINSGTISLLTPDTLLRTTAASAYTLAEGREGQLKFIKLEQYGGNATIAVPDLEGGTTITMQDAGDFIYLKFLGGKWNILTNSGCTIA